MPGLEVGPGDDAGVFRITHEVSIIETVDVITPVVDDPYIFGQIAATNALSDVYAMGGSPKTALVILGFDPCESSSDEIKAILKGINDTLSAVNVALIGGHTLEDKEMKVGLSVTGLASEKGLLLSKGAKPDDILILTKPIGSGVLTTALKGGKITMDELHEAIKWMTTLNAEASNLALEVSASACTDVTGFGLLGHAYNMVKGSSVELIIESQSVPFMSRVKELAMSGIMPDGAYKNYDFIKDRVVFSKLIKEPMRVLLCDPQTSGGLLIALNREALDLFDISGQPYFVIGYFRPGQGTIRVV